MKIAYKPQSTVGDAGMKTTMSARANLLTKRGALAAPVLVTALWIGLPAQSEARALASAVLNISELIWYQRTGAVADPSNDPALAMIIQNQAGSSVYTNAANITASLAAEIDGNSQPGASGSRPLNSGSPNLDLQPTCLGSDCPPYANNNFEIFSGSNPAPSGGDFVFADQLLSGSALGFAIDNNGNLTPASTGIGLRADVAKSDVGSATTTAALSLPIDTSQVRAPQASATTPVNTYFSVTYSYQNFGEIDAGFVGSTSTSLSFFLLVNGTGPFGTPGTFSLDLSQNSAQPTTVLSSDFIFTNNTFRPLFLQAAANASVTLSSVPVPSPPALLLIIAGLMAGIVIRRSSRQSERAPDALAV